MPFKSKAQQRKLFATNPAVAREFAAATPPDAYKNLPQHAQKKKHKQHAHMLAAALKKKP